VKSCVPEAVFVAEAFGLGEGVACGELCECVAVTEGSAAAECVFVGVGDGVSAGVGVAAGVASNGAEPAVQTTLGRYFQGINDHNYAEYQSAHNAQEQATEPKSAFGTGYGSTEDSGMTLVALQSTADGGESATVTFTSRQAAAASIDGSACNNWRVTYFLVPHGAGYLIGPAPAGYKPTYSDC